MRSRSIRTCLGTLGLALLLAPMVFAGFGGTDVYLPSVGRGPGAAGSDWYTTVWVYNPGVSAINVQFLMYERLGAGAPVGTYSDTIQPGDTARYPNAVENMFGLGNTFGAIRVVADDKVIVNSRIFSIPGGGDEADSVGQFFSGVPAEFAIGVGETTDLLGVYQTNPQASSEYRYNFGFMEVAGAQATVRASAVNDLGVVIATKDYLVGPFQPQQQNIADLVPGINQQNLRVSCQVVAGAGKVVVFGSGLANASSDPSTFEMAFSDALLGGGGTSGISTVNAGQGLSGGGSSAAVTLDVGAGDGISVSADTVSIANGGVTKAKLSAVGGSNGQVLGTNGSNLQWMDAGGGGGTITGITAGQGLTGGGSDGAVVLDVAVSDGITISGDSVALANGGVTKAKLSAAGGSAGQFLSTDGAGLMWANVAAGGLTLPFVGSVATNGKAFEVNNTANSGIGWAGFFKNTDAANTYPALVGASDGSGIALYGVNNGTGGGVKGSSTASFGVEAYSRDLNALYAHNNTSSGLPPGSNSQLRAAIWSDGGDAAALYATSSTAYAGTIQLENNVDHGRGIYAIATGDDAEAVYAVAGGGTTDTLAAYLQGNVRVNLGNLQVSGSVSKGGGSFKIDHPLDPANKYLLHSFVESPDMMNVYNGNVILDAEGRAVIELPDWFEALNREFRYQLTPIGAPGPNLFVAEEVAGNSFEIAGGTPGMKVSWQLTGVRHDAWAEAHRIPVEQDKAADEVGRYLHPEEHGVDPTLQIGLEHNE